jgi:hypothetical protein
LAVKIRHFFDFLHKFVVNPLKKQIVLLTFWQFGYEYPMKSVFYLFILSCCLLGCTELPTNRQIPIASSTGLLIGKKRWSNCQIKWANELPSSLKTTDFTKSITSTFDAFSKTGTFLTFVNQSPADIRVVAVAQAQLSNAATEGLFIFDQPTLADVSLVNGQYTIKVNQDYTWTANQLQYVVMNQLSAIMGISPNEGTNSLTQRFLPINPTLSLSDTELAQMRAMYPVSGLPTVKLGSPYTPTGAKTPIIEATVGNAQQVPQVLSMGHCWSSKNSTPTLDNNEGFSGGGLTISKQINSETVTTSLTGLTTGTRYSIRAYSRNACGVGYSDAVTYSKP